MQNDQNVYLIFKSKRGEWNTLLRTEIATANATQIKAGWLVGQLTARRSILANTLRQPSGSYWNALIHLYADLSVIRDPGFQVALISHLQILFQYQLSISNHTSVHSSPTQKVSNQSRPSHPIQLAASAFVLLLVQLLAEALEQGPDGIVLLRQRLLSLSRGRWSLAEEMYPAW